MKFRDFVEQFCNLLPHRTSITLLHFTLVKQKSRQPCRQPCWNWCHFFYSNLFMAQKWEWEHTQQAWALIWKQELAAFWGMRLPGKFTGWSAWHFPLKSPRPISQCPVSLAFQGVGRRGRRLNSPFTPLSMPQGRSREPPHAFSLLLQYAFHDWESGGTIYILLKPLASSLPLSPCSGCCWVSPAEHSEMCSGCISLCFTQQVPFPYCQTGLPCIC